MCNGSSTFHSYYFPVIILSQRDKIRKQPTLHVPGVHYSGHPASPSPTFLSAALQGPSGKTSQSLPLDHNFGWRGYHHLIQRWANNLSYQSITFPWPYWLGQVRLSVRNSDPKDTNLKRLELLQLLCTITGKSIYRWSQHSGNQAKWWGGEWEGTTQGHWVLTDAVPEADPNAALFIMGANKISSHLGQFGLFCRQPEEPLVINVTTKWEPGCPLLMSAVCRPTLEPTSPSTHPSTWSHMPYCSQSSLKRPILSVCPTAAVPRIKHTKGH